MRVIFLTDTDDLAVRGGLQELAIIG